MSKILIVKTSSMGDIIHTLPALTDAGKAIPNLSVDWVVEEAFAEIPKWHPLVDQVIPVAMRRFRKEPLKMLRRGQVKTFLAQLRKKKYDYIIDAQGLIKSSLITCLSRGLRCGLDRASAWEPLASYSYQKKIPVNPELHAITRMRLLFSGALGYLANQSVPDYGLNLSHDSDTTLSKYLLFIHGTTWSTKEWPEQYWQELTQIAKKNGYSVRLPWGNDVEKERAFRIAKNNENTEVLPRTSLTEIAKTIAFASGVVSVDTGLGHLAAALNVPTVSLYGPTDPIEVGTQGQNQVHLSVDFQCSPCKNKRCFYTKPTIIKPACFSSLPPTQVWQNLQGVIKN